MAGAATAGGEVPAQGGGREWAEVAVTDLNLTAARELPLCIPPLRAVLHTTQAGGQTWPKYSSAFFSKDSTGGTRRANSGVDQSAHSNGG